MKSAEMDNLKPSSASACDISPRDVHRESAVGWVSRSPSSPSLWSWGGPFADSAGVSGAAFGMARTGIRWFLVEQERGHYSFDMYEALYSNLTKAGVGCYWILAHGNPLVRSPCHFLFACFSVWC